MKKIETGHYMIENWNHSGQELHFIKVERDLWICRLDNSMTKFSAPTLRECRAHYGL